MKHHFSAYTIRLMFSASLFGGLPSAATLPDEALRAGHLDSSARSAARTSQDSVGIVRGRVLQADARPAANAVIVLEPGARRTVAGPDGAFQFLAVPRGTYVVRATADADVQASQRIRVTAAASVNVELRLTTTRLSNVKVTADRQLPTAASVATKTATPLLETPYSVSVVTSHQLEVQRPLSVNEALRYSAGVQAEQFGGVDNGYDFFVVRGFFGGSNGIFRDGVQLATPGFVGFRVEPYGTESFEVLRGAASVLSGQSSLGGMVNAVTKRAPQTAVREIMAEGGNFGTTQARVDVGGPVGSRGFSVRMTGVARNAGTQVEFGRNDRVFVAPALAWYGSKTTIDANVQFQSDDAGHFQFLPSTGTYLSNRSGVIPIDRNDGEPGFNRFDRRQFGAGYRVEHRIRPMVTLRQNARYDRVSADYDAVFGVGLDPDDASQRRLLRNAFIAGGTTDGVTIDNQAQFRLDGARSSTTILAGADYQHFRFTEADGIGEAPSLDLFAPSYGAPVERPGFYADASTTRTQTGLYLNGRSLIAKRLAASMGIRQNFLSSRTEDRLASATTSQDNTKLRLQAGLAYLSPAGVVPHVSYSESFLPVVGTDANGEPFKPESGRQFEAGIRYKPRDGAISVAAAGFDLRRQNVATPSLTNPALQIQTGEVRSRGVELEATGQIVTGLTVISAVTLQEVSITKSNAGDVGKRPSGIANSLASLWMDYEGTRGILTGLGFGAGVRYQGSTFGDADNAFEVDGFALADATVRYNWRRALFAIYAQNVFDKRHVAGCTGAGAAATCYYGRARTLIGSLRYRW